MSGVGILILAAGASTRLGQPKQLLAYQGRPLVRYVAEVALQSGFCGESSVSVGYPVAVVLGAHAAAIASQLQSLRLHLAYNPHWSTGMASSLRCGLQALLGLYPDLEAIVLMVCDQPFVSAELIHQLIAGYQNLHYPIVASEYAHILGVPALFHRTLFPQLLTLQGDVGAKSIIRQHASHCLRIPFARGTIDLDSPQDLANVLA